MATGMGRICTSSSSFSYPIEKVGYLYLYSVNAEIFRQNGNGLRQYPQGRVYLSSLMLTWTYRAVIICFDDFISMVQSLPWI